jgi:hypothetical protein
VRILATSINVKMFDCAIHYLCYKGYKEAGGVMILFKFMREMGIVIGLQDCVRKTRSSCIKTKTHFIEVGF